MCIVMLLLLLLSDSFAIVRYMSGSYLDFLLAVLASLPALLFHTIRNCVVQPKYFKMHLGMYLPILIMVAWSFTF